MRRFAVSCIAMLALAAVAPASPAAPPRAVAAKTCKAPSYAGNGYITSLTVRHTSCATGRKVTLAYQHCRLRHGIKGRCTKRVLGYSCSEKRQSIPTQFEATVRCRRGAKVVAHSYQQNT